MTVPQSPRLALTALCLLGLGDTNQARQPRLAFASKRDGSWNVYVMEADGSRQTRLTQQAESRFPVWSPDGRWIVFESKRDGDSEIYLTRQVYLLQLADRRVTRLTADSARDGDPHWSPDGTRLAFISDYDGASTVCVIGADGGRLTRLTREASLDSSWSR